MDLGDLLPSSKDLAKAKVEGFTHSTLLRFAKDLGARPEILRQIKSNEGRYDVETFMADFPQVHWEIAVDRVESYSVQDLFTTPTKSPVFATFVKHFPDWPKRYALMFFKAQGFTTLVIGTLGCMEKCGVVLKGTVKGETFFVTTYAEFADVIRDLGVLEA